jgi:hypothetical protein
LFDKAASAINLEEDDMTEEVAETDHQEEADQPLDLEAAVERLREHFSSVRVQVQADEGNSALSVRFIGNQASMPQRKLLTNSLAESLPPALSILGIGSDKEPGNAETSSGDAS